MPNHALLTAIASDRRGGISIIGALSLTGVAGMAGIAMETSNGYAVKVENQRVADAAALAGALALVADITSNTAAEPTARAVARANGIDASDVSVSVSPWNSPDPRVVTVRIDTEVPLRLTRVITDAISFNVVATGKAKVTPGTSSSSSTPHANSSACFLSLDSAQATTYGITVSGSASITGNSNGGCDVQAVRGITTTGSANIQARYIQANGNILLDGSAYYRGAEVSAGGTLTKPSWNSSAIITQPTANNWFSNKPVSISDPLATGSVQTALAKVTDTSNYPIPPQPAATFAVTPATGTANWVFDGTNGSGGVQAGWRSNGTQWNVPYNAAGYNLASISVIGGGTRVTFAPGTPIRVGNVTVSGSSHLVVSSSNSCVSASPTLCNDWVISGNLNVGGSGHLELGHGNYRIGGTANIQLPSTIGTGEFSVLGATSFGPYTHTLGAGLHRFGRLVVAGSGNVTMGAGDFQSVQDVSVGGSARLVLGTGTKTIGANAAGQSLIVDGSTLTDFGPGNATLTGAAEIGGSTTVRFGAGAVQIGSRVAANNTRCSTTTYNAACRSIYLSGSSNLYFGDGAFQTTGGIETGGSSTLTFGAASNHYIRGNMMLSGGVTFGAGAYTVYGSFTKTASLSATGSNVSFFLFGPIELSGSAGSTFAAPSATSQASDALADILFASLTSSASIYSGSSQNSYTGAVYVPNSPFTISGSGRIVSSGCFALIARTISVTGSGAGASKCPGIAAAGSQPSQASTPAIVALVR